MIVAAVNFVKKGESRREMLCDLQNKPSAFSKYINNFFSLQRDFLNLSIVIRARAAR